MLHANAQYTDKPRLTHQSERFSYAKQSHLTLVITCGSNINDMGAWLCRFVWYAMVWPRSWVYQVVFGLAGQGG